MKVSVIVLPEFKLTSYDIEAQGIIYYTTKTYPTPKIKWLLK